MWGNGSKVQSIPLLIGDGRCVGDIEQDNRGTADELPTPWRTERVNTALVAANGY